MTPALQARLDTLLAAGEHRVVVAIDEILADAERAGASDVHFEPTGGELIVRFRVDGVIRSVALLPRELGPNMVARLKVLAELLTYRTDIPQEGGIRPRPGQISADRRVSTFPTVHGEKAVVRIFQATAPFADLDQLGLSPEITVGLNELLQERSGAVFLTGPSGSGKTTTIYACLQRLARAGAGRHIVTIEDPVERLMDGVTQSQARPGTEFDFPRGLRSLLRQDPDVIMVGEIRDPETASVATEAALTGHLVFSTLHAGSAAGVIARLLEMGIEPHLLTSGVKGILNQRLLRRLCADCRAVGCPACLGSGFQGRFPVAELLRPDPEFRRAVLARADADALEVVARSSGMRPIRAAADAAVVAGETTVDEINRVLGPERR